MLGYLPTDYEVGTYDATTKKAVKIFQVYNGLTSPDGMVGNWTRGKLSGTPIPFSVIKKGDGGNKVKWVQNLFKSKGFFIVTVDGAWGNKSAESVKLWNYYKGNTEGNLESPTIEILYDLLDDDGARLNDISGYYKINDTPSDMIKKIRIRLYQAGFAKLSSSDVFDSDLENSVILYQTYGSVGTDGAVGNWTSKHLNNMNLFFHDIKYGQKGSVVKSVQEKLKNLGYMTLNADGLFGNGTKAAVLKFQNDRGLSATGTMSLDDMSTLTARYKYMNRVTKEGDVGEEVVSIQNKLKELGYLPANHAVGTYDATTKKAVQIFQAYNGIGTDGMVGKWTRKKIYGNANHFDIINSGEKSEFAHWTQELLKKKGFLIVTPDGCWGNKSAEGVKLWNYYKGNTNGNLESPTLDVLYDLLDSDGARINDISGYHKISDMPSDEIKKIRIRLYQAGLIELSGSNEFDTDLQDAVKLYQFCGGVGVDGEVGNWTDLHLNNMDIMFKELSSGASGSLVSILQKRLTEVGCFTAMADGEYGAKTIAAVKEFQTKNNITVTGEMGKADWEKLMEMAATAKTYTLKIGTTYKTGMKGTAITFLQTELKRLGYADYTTDGSYGNLTRGSVAMFQAYHGIGADGICGTKTISQMISANVKSYEPVPYGTTSEFVRAVQQKLYDIGIFKGNRDATYGPVTQHAIKTFQTQEGLTVTGTMNERTVLRIFSKNYALTTGIDVSEFNGIIDWSKVKTSGIKYAFIRVGGRYGGSGKIYTDLKYRANIAGVNNVGLKVGVYFYTQAIDVKEAKEEANFACDMISGYNVDLPIVYDMEILGKGRADGLSRSARTAIAKAFCEQVKARGYQPMLYSYTFFLNSNVNMDGLSDYEVWVAHYDVSAPGYKGKYRFWQYTSKGKVNGISSNYVDMNVGMIYY